MAEILGDYRRLFRHAKPMSKVILSPSESAVTAVKYSNGGEVQYHGEFVEKGGGVLLPDTTRFSLNSYESQLPDPRKLLRLTHGNSARARRDGGHQPTDRSDSCCRRRQAHALEKRCGTGRRPRQICWFARRTHHPRVSAPTNPEHASPSSPTRSSWGPGCCPSPSAPAKLKLIIRLWQLGASQDLFCRSLAPGNSCAGSRRQPRQSRRHQRRPRESLDTGSRRTFRPLKGSSPTEGELRANVPPVREKRSFRYWKCSVYLYLPELMVDT
jgi:hypothetical protein